MLALLLCCDCNRQTNRKLENKNKTNTLFYVCLASLSEK